MVRMLSTMTQSLPPQRMRDHYLRPDVVQDTQLRLNRLAGHVRAVKRMLAASRDCDELVIQLLALRAALTQVAVRLMESHVETCVSMIHTPEDQRQALDRLGAALAAALGSTGYER